MVRVVVVYSIPRRRRWCTVCVRVGRLVSVGARVGIQLRHEEAGMPHRCPGPQTRTLRDVQGLFYLFRVNCLLLPQNNPKTYTLRKDILRDVQGGALHCHQPPAAYKYWY